MYRPFAQEPNRRLWIAFRTANENLAGLQGAVRRVIHAQDPDMFIANLQPMEFLVGQTLAQPRSTCCLLAVFATVAMTLAAIGIYGVIAYTVAQRTARSAFAWPSAGQRGDMLLMVLRQSLTVVAIGIVVGSLVRSPARDCSPACSMASARTTSSLTPASSSVRRGCVARELHPARAP
jgi:hypothetical protein